MRRSATRGAAFRVAEAIAAGKTVADAAAIAGVSRATAFRYLQDPGVRAEIERLRAQILDQTAARLADASLAAVEALVSLLHGRSEMARVQAARAILEHAVNLRELVALEARVARLEAASQQVVGLRRVGHEP